jgi:transposase
MKTNQKRNGKKHNSGRSDRKKLKKGKLEPLQIRQDAAGIDIGSDELFAAVPPEKDIESVRRFRSFTADLHALADWLERCGVRTVAMESTGVYWIPVFQILEERGFEVCLVNAQHLRNVPGRKTDVSDCQWIQQVHSLGLLNASFRPAQQVCAVRSLLRHREGLIQMASQQVLLMQKALDQMNLQLHHVLSDITGTSGLAMLDAFLAGERDTARLAALREPQVKASADTIARALEGDYRAEHLFALKQSLTLYRFVQGQIAECSEKIRQELDGWETRIDPGDKPLGPPTKPIRADGLSRGEAQSLREQCYRILGVDLTGVDGINGQFIQVFLSEVGPDLSSFRSASAFASWLKLCPNQEISGGKVLKSKTGKNGSRMAKAFRMAANSLLKSESALGACFRRLRSKLGAPKAITAMAHKIARIVYHLVTTGESFDPIVLSKQQERQRVYREARVRKEAAHLGYKLVPVQA